MFNPANFGWPEFTYIFIVAVSSGVYLVKSGEPRDGNYSFGVFLVASIINFIILLYGGFFD